MTHDPGGRAPTGSDAPVSGGGGAPARGLRIGRVRGVPVYVSPITLLFAAIVAVQFAAIDRDRLPLLSDGRIYLLAGLTALGFLVSLLAHELGHAMVALGYGFTVHSVTVYGFAGITEFEPEPQTPAREFFVAAAGPAVNGVLAGAFYGLYRVVEGGTQPGLLLFDLWVTNLLLFGLNFLPGLPLDGGRVVVAGGWAATKDRLKGLRAGAYGGFAVAAAIAVFGVTRSGGAALYWVALAAIIGVGANQSLRRAQVRRRLPAVTAGRVARRTMPVEATLPLGEALRRAQDAQATAVVVVDADGSPTMVMNGAAVDALPEARRPWVTVGSVSRTIEPGMVLQASLTGQELLDAMERTPASEYVVLDGTRPVGVLSTVDVVARLDPAVAARMTRG